MKLNIAAVSVVSWQHGESGGMQRQFDLLVRGLESRGHRVTLITSRLLDPVEPFKQVDVVALPAEAAYGRSWEIELRRFFQTFAGPQVILSNSFACYPLLDCRLPVVPVIYGTGMVDLIAAARLLIRGRERPLNVLRELVRLMMPPSIRTQRRFLASCARIVAVSQETRRSLIRTYCLARDTVEVIPAPVDTDCFKPRDNAGQRHPGRPLHLLSAGTLSRQKGVEFLLEALVHLNHGQPDFCRLLIAGEGPERGRLQKMAGKLGLDSVVRFAGNLRPAELADAFRRSDLFVLPTLREEGFPLVVAESLASGVPVIATRVGGNPTAVRVGEDGLLVRPGSAVEIAEAVRRLADDPALRERMAGQARRRALAELDAVRVAEAVEALLLRVCGMTS